MKTSVEEVENEKNTVILKVEIPSEDVEPSIKKAYKEVSEKVRIPGFRKGKIPPQVIDSMIGKQAVLNEALDDMLSTFYPQAIEDSGVDPISPPQIDVEQLEAGKPLIFTAKIQTRPAVKLDNYKVITMEETSTKATKDEIEQRIERLRNRFTYLEPVKRAVSKGDHALIDYVGFTDGKPFEGGDGTDYMLEIGSGEFLPGFEDQLIGSKRGQDVEVKVTFPADYHSDYLAGRDATFNVVVKEIKTKKLPKIDDEFVKNVSSSDTLADLKKDLKKEIEETKEKQVKLQLREDVVKYLAKEAEIDVPSSMIENQMDVMVKEFENNLKSKQSNMEAYLAQMGDDIKNFREQYREEADERTRINLALEELVKVEKVEVSDADIDEEIQRLADNSKQEFKDVKDQFTDEHFTYLSGRLRMMKAIDLLVSRVKFVKEEKKEETDSKKSEATAKKGKPKKEKDDSK